MAFLMDIKAILLRFKMGDAGWHILEAEYWPRPSMFIAKITSEVADHPPWLQKTAGEERTESCSQKGCRVCLQAWCA